MSEDCGKVPYPNPLAAWRVVLAFTKPRHWFKHKELEPPRLAYRCQRCHAWHLAHFDDLHVPRPRPKERRSPLQRFSL